MATSKNTYGDGADTYVLNAPFATTAALVSSPVGLFDFDGVSLHLIVDFQQDEIAVAAGSDAVVASTGVWTFSGYTFTGKVGAKLVVSGAANPGNNGTFVITAVSGNTATTATAGLVNETFGTNVVVYVTRSEAASVPAGIWTVQALNDFAPNGIAAYGMPAQLGHPADISALFSSPAAIAAVVTAGSQMRQPPNHLSVRHLIVTFTPSGGLGTARCAIYAKSWSR